MKLALCILLGYLVGALNPAALIAKVKKKSLREHGTGNLGATNTLLVFGKKLGALVMLFDIGKGCLAVWIARWIAPEVAWLPLAAGLCAIIGHCFPFYLHFRGGKGLAAFGGVVLAYDPGLFLFLLISGFLLILIVNYSFILPLYASLFFAVHVGIREDSIMMLLLAVGCAGLIIAMHFGNFIKAVRGKDPGVRAYLKQALCAKRSKS